MKNQIFQFDQGSLCSHFLNRPGAIEMNIIIIIIITIIIVIIIITIFVVIIIIN